MVLENIYAHPKEDYWKFKGEEGLKSQKKSMNPKGMVGGGGLKPINPPWERWIFSITQQCISLYVIFHLWRHDPPAKLSLAFEIREGGLSLFCYLMMQPYVSMKIDTSNVHSLHGQAFDLFTYLGGVWHQWLFVGWRMDTV